MKQEKPSYWNAYGKAHWPYPLEIFLPVVRWWRILHRFLSSKKERYSGSGIMIALNRLPEVMLS